MGTWKPAKTAKYQINASVTAKDVELDVVSDFMLKIFNFAETKDLGFTNYGEQEWGVDDNVWFDGVDTYNQTCFLMPGDNLMKLNVSLESFGNINPAAGKEVTVKYRVWDNDTGGADTEEQGWKTMVGPWDEPFVFDQTADYWDMTAAGAGRYKIEVWYNTSTFVDGQAFNNWTNRTICLATPGTIDMTPTIDSFVDGGSMPKLATPIDFTIHNVGLLDLPNPDNVAVNITIKAKGTHNTETTFYKAVVDTTGGAEKVMGTTAGSTPAWNPATVGWYVINITTGWMDSANEADDYDDNNMTSYEVQIVNPAKSIDVDIKTPVSGEYPHDYWLKVNTTVTNTGDVSTSAAGGDINVTLEMSTHGSRAVVYSKVMTLGDHLAAGAANTSVIFNVPATAYMINTNYDIVVWVNVTNATGHSQYSDAGDFINVTFYYPPNGTISGTVTNGTAGYTVMATNVADSAEVYYTTTTAGGAFDFDPQTFDWNHKWTVAFDGRYMYTDDSAVDQVVAPGADTVVALETTMKPKARVNGTIEVIGADDNIDLKSDVFIADAADTTFDSKATVNVTAGTFTMMVYADNIVDGVSKANITASVPGFAKWFDASDEDAWEMATLNKTMTAENVTLVLEFDPMVDIEFDMEDDTYVKTDTKIEMVFSDAIDPATVNQSTIKVTGAGVPAYNATHFDISDDNKTVKLELPEELMEGETYTLNISMKVMMHGAAKAVMPWDYLTTFETAMAGGSIMGTVTDSQTTEPIEGVTVSAGAVEAVTDAAGEYELFVEAGDHTVGVVKANWRLSTGPAGAVTVAAGGMAYANFTMFYAPYGTSSPMDGAIDVPVADFVMSITFLEAMNASTFNDTTVTLEGGARAMVPGTVNFTDNMTLTWAAAETLLYNTSYTFTVAKEAMSAADMPFDKDIVIGFTTVARTFTPLVVTFDPVGGSTGVALDYEPKITFSAEMDTNASGTAITLYSGATAFAFTLEWEDNFTAVLKHDTDFAALTNYTMSVGAGVMPQSTQVKLMADAKATFTTGAGDGGEVPTVEVTFGPFLDEDGNPLVGWTATLVICGNTYTGTTDSNGMVTFTIPEEDWLDCLGQDADFELTLTHPDWKGSIVVKGKLSDLVLDADNDPKDPAFEYEDTTEEKEGDKDDDDGVDYTWIIVGVIVIIVIIVVLMMVAGKGKKEEEEMPADEEEGEKGEFECPSCGAMVAGDSPECPECGEVFEADQFRCPECGAEVEPGMDECGECGEPLEVPEKPAEGEEGEAPVEGEEGEAPEGEDDFDVESEEEPMEDFGDEEGEDDFEDEDDDFEDEEDEDELDLDEEEEEE